MIHIQNEEDCVGCNACRQICPRNCITMHRDGLGFNYPEVDADKCINCGLCEHVCPVIHQAPSRRPLAVYAAKNPNDDVRLASSSGGVFTAIARKVITDGGVVFGARFDSNWRVIHDFTESLDGLKAFQGSKYVQSEILTSFIQAEKFLKAGRTVLFSGTPCQLAALKLFLRKDYGERLIKLDVVCHGVPGPEVLENYLDRLTESLGTDRSGIRSVAFRDKRLGWRRFGLTVDTSVGTFFEPLDTNLYLRIFLKNLDLRPACYSCPAKCGKSHSDITLADFWKLRKFHADIFDEKGVSLLMVNSEHGRSLIESIPLRLTSSSYENGLHGNPSIERSATLPPEREEFLRLFKLKDFEAIAKLISRMTAS